MPNIIDAHLHWHDVSTYSLNLMEELDVQVLNICVARDAHGAWRDHAHLYRSYAREYSGRFAWCTTFDLPRFDDPQYIEKTVAQIESDFADGAVACKVWKNIGMEHKKPSGEFLLVDDPLLDPIWETITASGRPLMAHIGEPYACWQPLDDDNPHSNYYRNFPQWHMYNHPEYPSHETLMAARDRVLEKHPKLKMVGAHLASLEYDADVLRERLDRYPNLAVDTSARLTDLALQDPQKVRRLFEAHPDRILFGTDAIMRQSSSALTDEERQEKVADWRQAYTKNLDYYRTAGPVTIRGKQVPGLNLPSSITARFFRENALEWYPHLNK